MSRDPVGLADRALEAVRTGRFERTLSALTAAGAVITTLEIYTSHDSASFGNKMMWWPVVIVPTAVPAGIAGVISRRAARTVLPVASALIVANGLQGDLPARARGRAEAGRLVDGRLQRRDGSAGVRPAAG